MHGNAYQNPSIKIMRLTIKKNDIRFKFTNSSKRNCQHDNHAILYAIEYNIIILL